MSDNFKNPNPNIPREILDLMPTGKDALPSHEPVPGAAEHYRGVPVDPATGHALDPFKCRDPKANARRTNPRGGQMARLDDDAPWGC